MRTLMLSMIFVVTGAGMSVSQERGWTTLSPPPSAGRQPPQACCQPPCACCESPCTKTICVPQPEIVKTTRAIYDVNVKPYCLPKCPLGLSTLLGGHGCGCCPTCCDCGHPHVRHVLLKRFVTEEHETCKCVPVCVPACPECGETCGQAPGGCGYNPARRGEAMASPDGVAPLPSPASPK